jgi:hypothetical protein
VEKKMVNNDEPSHALLKDQEKRFEKITNDLIIVQNRLYAQFESLTWLQRQLSIKGQLPPLRGWAMSPDILLQLHTYIINKQPKLVVELGCGASTIVIADAMRQNGCGQLISLEHSSYYAGQTLSRLEAEDLHPRVSLRVDELVAWEGQHLNLDDAENSSRWYSQKLLDDVSEIELLLVDGPSESTCKYARYPALPALFDRLASKTEIWMDDTIRKDEKEICKHWADIYGFELEFSALEKGLGILRRV